jgi:hypothetical protein
MVKIGLLTAYKIAVLLMLQMKTSLSMFALRCIYTSYSLYKTSYFAGPAKIFES